MKLSILIPLYNKEKYVERCLTSLLNQDIPKAEYEIVIVDDGSKDSGPEIVEQYAKTNSNIQLIRQENQGPSAARNKCLDAAKGNYLYFMDADDYLAENVFGRLLSLCEQGNVGVLEFDTKETNNSEPTFTVCETTDQPSLRTLSGMAYMAEYGFRNEAWRYFVKKALLESSGVRFIEGTLYEDAIFTASLFLKAESMAKVALDVHRYVVVENSIVTSKDKAHNLKFIHGMVFAIEHFNTLVQDLDTKDPYYEQVVKKLKERQQALDFAIIIRTLKYRPLEFAELKQILNKLRGLEAYPIDPKIGGIGQEKSSWVHSLFVPVFNNRTLLYFGMGLMRVVPS